MQCRCTVDVERQSGRQQSMAMEEDMVSRAEESVGGDEMQVARRLN